MFDEQEAYQIFLQIINGMNELVKLHIVHRDLKPANILYNKGVFKLADFGLAKYVDHECQLLRTQAGTPFYMAPQILLREKYTSKCDIWSLGIIYYQLLFGKFPWPLGK
jgi:serine/threonine-protein kinase ULK/ATG1